MCFRSRSLGGTWEDELAELSADRSDEDSSHYCTTLAMCHQSLLGAKGFSAARARKAFRVARTLRFRRGNTVQSVQNSLAAAVIVFVVSVCSSWRLRLPALLRWCFRADWRRHFPLPHLSLLHPWWMLITPSVKSREDKMKRLSARSWQGGSHVTRTDNQMRRFCWCCCFLYWSLTV